MSFLSVAGASQIYFHYCILSSSSEDLAIKKRQPQQHPKKTKKKKSSPRGWSVTVKHATRCISEQATGKISVIWLSLVTQFTLVLHEERKKEERGKKRKTHRWKSGRCKPRGIKSVHLSRSLLNYVSRIHVQIVCESKNGRLPLGRLLGYAPSRSGVMRCAAPLCSAVSVEV